MGETPFFFPSPGHLNGAQVTTRQTGAVGEGAAGLPDQQVNPEVGSERRFWFLRLRCKEIAAAAAALIGRHTQR